VKLLLRNSDCQRMIRLSSLLKLSESAFQTIMMTTRDGPNDQITILLCTNRIFKFQNCAYDFDCRAYPDFFNES
jgi:hypothetical protein